MGRSEVKVQKLNEADPHFIRCVKPNPEKVPDKFASALSTRAAHLQRRLRGGPFEAFQEVIGRPFRRLF